MLDQSVVSTCAADLADFHRAGGIRYTRFGMSGIAANRGCSTCWEESVTELVIAAWLASEPR